MGVVLKENLSWKAHVKYLIAKGGKRAGMLGRLRKNLTEGAANILYKSVIVPIFDYCDGIWFCFNKHDARKQTVLNASNVEQPKFYLCPVQVTLLCIF